jgi:hypothetical protein
VRRLTAQHCGAGVPVQVCQTVSSDVASLGVALQVYPGEKTGDDVVVETDAVWASSATIALRVSALASKGFWVSPAQSGV